MKHTKGPWRTRANGEVITIDGDVDGAFYCGIAQINPGGYSDKGTPNKLDRANARLIAAAPDLLDACKELKELEQPGSARLLGFAKAQAAIAKAEGKP